MSGPAVIPNRTQHWPEAINCAYAPSVQPPGLCLACGDTHRGLAVHGDQSETRWREKAAANTMRIAQLLPTDEEQAKGPFLFRKSVLSMMPEMLWDAAVWNRVWGSLPVKLDMPSINYPGQPRNGGDYIIGNINVSITIHDKSITAYIIEADRRVVWFLGTGIPDEYCPKTLDDLHMSRLLGKGPFKQYFLGTDHRENDENVFTGNQNQHILSSIVQILTHGAANQPSKEDLTMSNIIGRLEADMAGGYHQQTLKYGDVVDRPLLAGDQASCSKQSECLYVNNDLGVPIR